MLLLVTTCTAPRYITILYVTYIVISSFFFFNDTATTEIYPLSLHDALPIFAPRRDRGRQGKRVRPRRCAGGAGARGCGRRSPRSEEHTSELQSQSNIVCPLLLLKK